MRAHVVSVAHATAQLGVWLALSAVLGGCAFPLFNVKEERTSRTVAYRTAPQALPSADTTRKRGTTANRVVGARQRSVMDPTPAEPSDEASSGACYRALRSAGVAFERAREPTPGVRWPIRLTGPVRGVLFSAMDRDRTHSTLDCRLGLALVDWARELRKLNVRRVEYFSMYRPGARVGGDGPISGHAYGLAIDAAKFELTSGEVLDVEHGWQRRERGGAPCPLRRDENRGSRLLRNATCRAADRKLFEVILTPHYNRAHFNHVHLERRPDVTWDFVH